MPQQDFIKHSFLGYIKNSVYDKIPLSHYILKPTITVFEGEDVPNHKIVDCTFHRTTSYPVTGFYKPILIFYTCPK